MAQIKRHPRVACRPKCEIAQSSRRRVRRRVRGRVTSVSESELAVKADLAPERGDPVQFMIEPDAPPTPRVFASSATPWMTSRWTQDRRTAAMPVGKSMRWNQMWCFLKVGFLVLAGLVISSSASSDQTIYSHQFDQAASYLSGSTQYDDWLSFRASLPASDVSSITVSGSQDSVGRTCSDPVKAQQIADAMFAGASGTSNGTITLSVNCDGFNWNTGSCSLVSTDANNLELNVGPGITMCGCSTGNDTARPGITGGTGNNFSWGGIAGATCAAPTQTMTVTVNFVTATDTDADGVLDGDDLCPDTAPNDPVDAAACSDAQLNADADDVPDADDLQTVVVNGCDSGVANDVLPSGPSIVDLLRDAFNWGGVDAVKDALADLRRDGILSKHVARAIKRCAKDGYDDDDVVDDDDDRRRGRGYRREHKREHRHGHNREHRRGHRHGRGL